MAKRGRKKKIRPQDVWQSDGWIPDIKPKEKLNHVNSWQGIKLTGMTRREGKGDDDVYNASPMPNLR